MSNSRYLSVMRGIAWRNLHNVFARPALLLPPLLMPVFFFAAFAGGLSSVGDVPGFDYSAGYTSFQFVFVLVQSCAFAGVFTGFAIAADFEFGLGRRLMLATPHRSAIIAGYGAAAFFRAALTLVVLTGIALAVGANFDGDAIQIAGLYGLALLVNLVGTLLSAGVALRFRSLQSTPLMQMPVFLLLMLTPVFAPRELLSGWVHTVSSWDPLTAIIESGRNLLAGQPADFLIALAVTAGLIAALMVFALTGLRKAEQAG